MSSEPQKVDWTVDEAVKCEDCIHSYGTYQGSSRLECRKFGKYAMNHVTLLRKDYPKSTFGFEVCGSEGKGFERKVPDVFDFHNNPPPLMQWAM